MKMFQSLRHWAAAGMLAGLAACSGGGSDGPSLSVNVGLAPTEGSSCVLLDTAGQRLAGPALTQGGRASFGAVPRSNGTGQIVCEGGRYLDPATGDTVSSPRLRAVVTLDQAVVDSSVTPVTELAVRLLGSRAAASTYPGLLTGLATSLGLSGVDVARVAPLNLNTSTLGSDAASQYGALLAGFSQWQLMLRSAGAGQVTLGELLDEAETALEASGRFTDAAARDSLSDALEALPGNARLSARIGSGGRDTVRAVFDRLMREKVVAAVDAVFTEADVMENGPSQTVLSNATSTLAIVGRNLYLALDVRLNGQACVVHDLESLNESEIADTLDVMLADCQAPASGTAQLVVTDQGKPISTTRLTVVDVLPAARAKAGFVAPRATGDANVSGQVTAVAPSIDLARNGALSYTQLRNFNVKGVVVELLDRDAGDALIASTSTDDNGRYHFVGVPSGKRVVVRAKAQLLKLPTAASAAQWNFAVRDNTSTTSPKALYALDAAPVQTASGDNTVNLNAGLGFDAQGRVTDPSGKARQSAPFSILEVVYSAATKLQQTDAAVNLPPLNIYWSVNNVGASGEKEQGQIGTSHYSGGGTLPGVFILGKADSDTDEFDQGVIGHEFGHYLQDMLSYSDSPGGKHSNGEFKDPSLAYGEGYGTAVGGLLSGSPYYTDSSGPQQSLSGLTDLTKPSAAGVRKGFYSEESVAYVMYNLGIRQGFPAFWRAVSALRANHHSATIFAFLNAFLQQNPAAQAVVSELMATENFRTSDPLGQLPAGAAPDPAINAQASQGAGDLEAVYLPLSVSAGAPPSSTSVVAPSASFCLNSRLPGAEVADSNGLGLSRRFSFTAPYSGYFGLRPTDDKGQLFGEQTTDLNVRDSTGNKVDLLVWPQGSALFQAVAGRTYSIKVQATANSVFGGNRCGNQLALWWVQPPAN